MIIRKYNYLAFLLLVVFALSFSIACDDEKKKQIERINRIKKDLFTVFDSDTKNYPKKFDWMTNISSADTEQRGECTISANLLMVDHKEKLIFEIKRILNADCSLSEPNHPQAKQENPWGHKESQIQSVVTVDVSSGKIVFVKGPDVDASSNKMLGDSKAIAKIRAFYDGVKGLPIDIKK